MLAPAPAPTHALSHAHTTERERRRLTHANAHSTRARPMVSRHMPAYPNKAFPGAPHTHTHTHTHTLSPLQLTRRRFIHILLMSRCKILRCGREALTPTRHGMSDPHAHRQRPCVYGAAHIYKPRLSLSVCLSLSLSLRTWCIAKTPSSSCLSRKRTLLGGNSLPVSGGSTRYKSYSIYSKTRFVTVPSAHPPTHSRMRAHTHTRTHAHTHTHIHTNIDRRTRAVIALARPAPTQGRCM
jgi:hypothetical protein